MLPKELIRIIGEFYGNDDENYIRRGLRYMFLVNPAFFTWGSDREDTLHVFLQYYETQNARAFIDQLLGEINWQEAEGYWASSSELTAILSQLNINVKTCRVKHKRTSGSS